MKYIVVHGLSGGYMPDSVDLAYSLKEAISIAREIKNEYLNANTDLPRQARWRVKGDIRRDRLYIITPPSNFALPYYVEIRRVTEHEIQYLDPDY